MDQERIVRGLAAALPEAFAGCDLVDEYHSDWGEPEQAGNGAIGRWPVPPAPRRKGARHSKL